MNRLFVTIATILAVGILVSYFAARHKLSVTDGSGSIASEPQGLANDDNRTGSLEKRRGPPLVPDMQEAHGLQDTHEYFSAFDSDDQVLYARAQMLANETMHRYPADFALRWEPIRLDDVNLVLQDASDDNLGGRMPRAQIRLTPFAGISFVAQNRRFREEGYGYSWRGTVTGGITGSVVIHTVPEEAFGTNVAFVTINSEIGAFRVEPTSDPDIYVAYEANRFFNPPQHRSN